MHNGRTITYWAPKMGELGVKFFEPPVYTGGEFNGDVLDDVDEVTVDYKIQTGGFVCLGKVDKADPREIPEAREIVEVGTVPCLRSLKNKQVAFLN